MKKAIVIAVVGLTLASAVAYAQMQHGPSDMRQGEHMMGGMPMMRGAMMQGGMHGMRSGAELGGMSRNPRATRGPQVLRSMASTRRCTAPWTLPSPATQMSTSSKA